MAEIYATGSGSPTTGPTWHARDAQGRTAYHGGDFDRAVRAYERAGGPKLTAAERKRLWDEGQAEAYRR